MSPDEVLEFWFVASGPGKWYNGGDGFDAEIRQKFEATTIEFTAIFKKNKTHKWEQDEQSVLALILLFDQFPRNMYRGTKAAFAFDDWGLQIAQRAIERGYDLKAPQDRRAFFYMPFMHTEDLTIQDECVHLIDMRIENENTVFHAREHQKLIAKYGRFPYRNEVLGRTNTRAEEVFLRDGGYTP